MDQKLSELVNKVDREARQYASFDDYLAASKDKEATEWQKPATVVEESSSSDSSAKVEETAGSTETPNAEPATEPKDPRVLAAQAPNYIANGLKTEPLAHPLAPNVTAEEPTPKPTLEAQIVATKYRLHSVEFDKDRIIYASEETVVQPRNPDWEKDDIYLAGRGLALAQENAEAVVDWMNTYQERIQKLNRAIQGMRGVLEEKLHGETAETRKRLVDKAARGPKNQSMGSVKAKAGTTATKAAAAPKVGIGVKLAEAQAAMLEQMRKPVTAERILKFLKENNQIDEATTVYVENKWGAK